MKTQLLKEISWEQAQRIEQSPVDSVTLEAARTIVNRVRDGGESAVREYAARFDDRGPTEPLLITREALDSALESINAADRAVLERSAQRIELFARTQRDAIRPVTVDVPGGQAGHTVEAVGAAGCYAPGGRYPLPSSVLMTAITARVAGCDRVVVASPSVDPIMLAAAAIAGADEFLALGGAHAVASMAYGFDGFDRCDVIAGPGNSWVTAAKQIVSGSVGIDMLAGPSELLVLADQSADPALIAADLLAQAEHDTQAVPLVVTNSQLLIEQVNNELERQLPQLQTASIAQQSLKNGWIVVEESWERCKELVDRVAPEHLEIMSMNAADDARSIRNAGAIFIGSQTAEVLGDYGSGPNHTLPTGGTARFQSGLSVMNFLRLRTWLKMDGNLDQQLASDTQRLAQLEGLAGHEASVRIRSGIASRV